MSLLVPAHPGCPGQNPESHKTVVCVFVQRDSEQVLKDTVDCRDTSTNDARSHVTAATLTDGHSEDI